MKKVFLIIGAPGSGKTTDAQIIAKSDERFEHFSTGNLLRDEVDSGSELGKLIHSFISKGELVPLNVVIDTITTAIKRSAKRYVLIDGYPRSVEQMLELDRVISKRSEIELAGVIEVDVSEETARQRALSRARGNDDSAEVFANRMSVYRGPIEEIREFYKKSGLFFSISGEGGIEKIVLEMTNLIVNLIKEQ